MKTIIISLCAFLMLISLACEKKVDIEAEKAEIFRILAADDQELLDGVIKDDRTDVEESINIMQGNLVRLTQAEVNRRNKTLLEKGKFIKIENLDGPIINVSPDGNMAWVAVKTKFVIAYKDSLGIDKEWEGIESRLEVYENKENKWDAVACALTF